MSLQQAVKEPEHPLRLLLDETFPDLRSLVLETRAALADSPGPFTRPAAGVSPTLAGVAFDYRFRYFFGITPPEEFVAFRGMGRVLQALLERDAPDHPARLWYQIEGTDTLFPAPPDLAHPALAGCGLLEFWDHIEHVVDHVQPVGRRIDPDAERSLARVCLVLGLLEQVARAMLGPTSPFWTLTWDSPLEDILDLVDEEAIDDIVGMSRAFHQRQGARLPARTADLNPRFAGSRAVGGADADLVWDGHLIELKTSAKADADINWFRQLFGYVALDWDDALHIEGIGLYMARQAVLVEWPMEQAMRRAGAGVGVRVEDLRDRCHELLAANKEDDDD